VNFVRLKPAKNKAEVEMSFTKVLFFIFLAVTGWVIYEVSFAYYASIQIEHELTAILLSNRSSFDEVKVAEQVRAKLPQLGSVKLDEKGLSILRSADGQTGTLSVPYIYEVRIPFSSKVWEIQFHPVIQENLAKKNY